VPVTSVCARLVRASQRTNERMCLCQSVAVRVGLPVRASDVAVCARVRVCARVPWASKQLGCPCVCSCVCASWQLANLERRSLSTTQGGALSSATHCCRPHSVAPPLLATGATRPPQSALCVLWPLHTLASTSLPTAHRWPLLLCCAGLLRGRPTLGATVARAATPPLAATSCARLQSATSALPAPVQWARAARASSSDVASRQSPVVGEWERRPSASRRALAGALKRAAHHWHTHEPRGRHTDRGTHKEGASKERQSARVASYLAKGVR